MNKVEYLSNIENCPINKDRISCMMKIYNVEFSDTLARIISYADSADFIDDERRVLTFEEIVDAGEQLGVDFVSLGMIPIIDAYDNDYIVYVFGEAVWAKFNTIDQVTFKKKNTLQELI